MFLRHMWKHQNICNIFIGHILSNETGVKYIVCLTSNIYKRYYPNPKRAMLFNLPLLYAAPRARAFCMRRRACPHPHADRDCNARTSGDDRSGRRNAVQDAICGNLPRGKARHRRVLQACDGRRHRLMRI